MDCAVRARRLTRTITVQDSSTQSAQTAWRRFRLPLLVLAATAGLIILLVATRPELTPVERPERVWPVEVEEIRQGTVTPELRLFGEIVAGRRSELRPQVAGVIVEVGESLHEGGMAEKGALLLRIDPFDYQTGLADQRAMLTEARARLEKLRRDLKRARELFAEKNVSEQFLDDAQLAVTQQESLVQQREIGVQRSERDLADTRLLAPFSGVLANVNADLGKQVSDFGDAKIADLIDTSRLEARFSLTNTQYGRLINSEESLLGRPVQVLWDVGDEPVVYAAVIARVGGEIAATTGGIEVYATIDSAGSQTALRPGAFVRINLPDRAYSGVFSAPESVLYGEDRLYVVEDGRMSERRVRVVGYTGSDILFESAGSPALRDGDRVVITQLREGGAGARVSVR